MKIKLHIILLTTIVLTACDNSISQEKTIVRDQVLLEKSLRTAAEQTDKYFPLLKGKTIAIVANQTSMIGNIHLVDSLHSSGIKIKSVFAPEHGFRGEAGAGEHIKSGIDPKTKIPIVSLYGNKKKPTAEDLKGVNMVVFDIQDVGARFYTYISTLFYLMEACAENNIPLLVLDRPNPNGHFIDGPVLEKEFTSFVGIAPIPVVHGLTVGEFAQMVNGE
ncbi:MAG: exo-beta-N-acetylmuramidase NamZ family protein [Bacteroidia bacterium]